MVPKKNEVGARGPMLGTMYMLSLFLILQTQYLNKFRTLKVPRHSTHITLLNAMWLAESTICNPHMCLIVTWFTVHV